MVLQKVYQVKKSNLGFIFTLKINFIPEFYIKKLLYIKFEHFNKGYKNKG